MLAMEPVVETTLAPKLKQGVMKGGEKRKRIVVGINSLTESQYPAYSNHLQVWFRFGRSYPDYDFILVNPSRMSIDRMRNMTVKTALECEADYVLFIDDDVLVPIDALAKLIACEAECAAGKAVIRGYPFDWMVFSKLGDESKGEPAGLNAYKELPDGGILEIGAVGFCCTLLKVDLFRPMKPPYFVTGVSWTEDIYFFLKAKQASPAARFVVDCSVDCGHILWPEVMTSKNRAAYKKMMEELDPQLLDAKLRSIHEPMRPPTVGVDHGQEYMNQIQEVLRAQA